MVRFQTNSKKFTDLMLMMTLHQAQNLLATLQFEGVEINCATKSPGDNFGF